MKLAISGQLLGSTLPLEEILKIINKFGVRYIELWPENIPGVYAALDDEQKLKKEIEKVNCLLDKYNIKVACMTTAFACDLSLVKNPKLLAGKFARVIDIAKGFGCRFINHYCDDISRSEEPDFTKIRECFSPAVEAAEKNGITLVLENEAHDSTRTPELMLSIINAINSKVYKTNYDATNYYHAGCEGFPYAYDMLKKHIAYVHLKNACIYNPASHTEENKGSDMTGLLKGNCIYYTTLGDGAVNIDGILKRLLEDGYDGFCTLEPHTTPASAELFYQEDIKYLKQNKYFKGE